MNIQKLINHFVLKYLVVPKPPVVDPNKKKIACIGDSITFGAGVDGKKEQTWEYFLEQKLGSSWQVLNYGISGRTLLASGDYPYVREKFYSISKQAAADIYLIMLGTNDSKPYNWREFQYRLELRAFLAEYKDLPNKPKVVLMTPPTCFVDDAAGIVLFDINKDIVADQVYSIVTEAAKEQELSLIDLHAYTNSHKDWFVDGVHPNQLGNEMIADYIYQELKL